MDFYFMYNILLSLAKSKWIMFLSDGDFRIYISVYPNKYEKVLNGSLESFYCNWKVSKIRNRVMYLLMHNNQDVSEWLHVFFCTEVHAHMHDWTLLPQVMKKDTWMSTAYVNRAGIHGYYSCIKNDYVSFLGWCIRYCWLGTAWSKLVHIIQLQSVTDANSDIYP